MPWSMEDYPASLKHLDKPVKKKAIEIANAMVDEGYDESRAIPIATSQAKEWANNRSKSELKSYAEEANETERGDSGSSSRPELAEKCEHVIKHEKGWAVKGEDAKRASEVKGTKAEAVERAKEIAENKGTAVIVHKKDGSVERKIRMN
ncbi:DUF2188 domain-containing protein [Bacillus haynesii]|uniref:DUF2188 domain-containing protein n=1 Tax=Bacillus haynesii TaxID=1925021 RepID=UPI001592E8A2|nr:DUF2188 domain-containing protein [Bacillus haynesii]NVB35550.1 DUF2188 domain-containing protein [Bacillus licheniformis]MCY7778057.1 DUF2188 domain-containing protein [Bacillus haynesii]MCY7817651.1 DUF2188 domain-containing protein [Bacillus haynesii]MCY8225031.1 DUF2188 domain-containing protein [Bacillus haynesii]MCY8243332.1 DUF2188 domain-containing protein [Bacillus haynesii]